MTTTQLVPTEARANVESLSADEFKVYDLIARRYLAVFYPNYIYNTTKIITTVEQENFLTKGTTIVQKGWTELNVVSEKEKKKTKEDVLPNVVVGQEETAKKLAEILSESGLNAKYSNNIHYSIYRKACVNGTMNGLCTILDTNMAGLGETKPAHDMVVTIVNEFAAVAKFENVNLDIAEVVQHVETCFDPSTIGLHYPSMYQDLIKNNRLTEIDYINGAVSRKGKNIM